MKACVDKDACIGCGLCIATCSDIFLMDDDGKAKASDNEIPSNLVDLAKDAESMCPVSAISVK